MRTSGAETLMVSAEAESGIIDGNASKLAAQTGASGQEAVKFGADSCIVPASQQLQDQDPEDSPETPWERTEDEVLIYFETGQALPEHAEYIKTAAGYWGRSPCLDTREIATCPAAENCVKVVSDNAGGGDTDGEFEGVQSGGFRVGGTITLYTDILNQEQPNGRLVTTVHEMGHAVGLVHRLNPDSMMNATTDDTFNPEPDEVDYQNLLVIYGTKQ